MSASRPGLGALALALSLAGVPTTALAQEVTAEGPVSGELHGDVKSFFVATFPPPEADWPEQLGMNPDPEGSGVIDLRLKGTLRFFDAVELEVHHDLVVLAQAPSTVAAQQLGGGGASFGSSGVGRTAPEAIDLTWELPAEDERTGSGNLLVRGRIDRLVLRGSLGRLDLALGRQAIGFGSGLIFTPLDLVNPFFPGTIDTEYRPGVDALRADLFLGMTGRVGVAAAYAGDWDLGGTVIQATGQGTLGVTDLMGLVGSVHGDGVVGLGVVSSVGAVGVHGDVSLTSPDLLHEDAPEEDEQCYSIDLGTGGVVQDPEGGLCQDLARITDPYVRAVLGADVRPTGTSFVSAEVYWQSFGGAEASEAVLLSFDERYQRGELWQTGQLYGALSASQEITPIVATSLAVIANLGDPSALVAPGLSWGVADEVTVGAGAYIGVGAKPGEPELEGVFGDFEDVIVESLSLESELGAVPPTGFVQLKAYF